MCVATFQPMVALSFRTISTPWFTPIFPRTLVLGALSSSAFWIYGFMPGVSVPEIRSGEKMLRRGL
jgi:hypothetical protein